MHHLIIIFFITITILVELQNYNYVCINKTDVCVLIGIRLDKLVHCIIVTSIDKDGYVDCIVVEAFYNAFSLHACQLFMIVLFVHKKKKIMVQK